MLKSLVPELRSRPKLANQVPPRRQIVGATATVSTFATVVGQPKTPRGRKKNHVSINNPVKILLNKDIGKEAK